MDSIRVGIRVRPLLAREKNGMKWLVQGENAIVPTTPGSAGFEFDHVFGEASTTDQIYTTITRPIVHSVMEGFNGTVFAYGQTSSGKTFTMTGTEYQPGVIPMAIQEIFDYVEDHEELEFIVRVSYLEIYKEGICDLLDPTCTDLKIREDRDNHVRVHGLKEYVVTNIEEVTRVIYVGNVNRTTGETNMNERSSRSHAVLSIAVESRVKNGDGTVKVATLNLVDLAGSERLNATGAAGKRAQEGIAINKSLFTLKQVISKLSEGNPSIHVPYRDSKLTHILKPSLGGNAKTAIICAVTPAESYETELTLNFAICAMKVKNRPMVNEVLGGEDALKKKLKQLEKENEVLRSKLSNSESTLTEEMRKELMEQIDEKECRQDELEAHIRSLEQIIIKSKSQNDEYSAKPGDKYNRRRTICPATLARGMGSPLLIKPSSNPRHSVTPVVTPEIVHRSVSRLKRDVQFSTPSEATDNFQSFFNSSGFERELITEQIVREAAPTYGSEDTAPPTVNVRDLERRRTMFRCPTFVVDTPGSTGSGDQTVWQEMETQLDLPSLTDVQVQTEGGVSCVASTQTVDNVTSSDMASQTLLTDSTTHDVHTQTEHFETSESDHMTVGDDEAVVMREEEEDGLPATASMNSSFCLCTHHKDVCSLNRELQQHYQFHNDEVVAIQKETEEKHHHLTQTKAELVQTQQTLQAEREKSQGLETKLSQMEMASTAQEEYLTKLCEQSKMSARRQGELEDKLERQIQSYTIECESWEAERNEMKAEATLLKEQLQSLHTELEKLPHSKRHCSEPSTTADDKQELTALTEKLQESEVARKTESEQFQQCYQQKVTELQKAQEKICYLQEQLEEAEQQATPISSIHQDSHTVEEIRAKEREIQEKEAMIDSLQNEVSCLEKQLSDVTENSKTVRCNLESQLTSASSDLSDVRASLQTKSDAIDQMERIVTEMKTQLESATEQLQEAETLLQTKSSALEEAEGLVTSVQSRLRSAEDQLHETQTALQEKVAEMEAASSQLCALQSEVEALRQGETEAVKHLEIATSQLQQQESALQEKVTELSVLSHEVASLRDVNTSLTAHISQLMEDHAGQMEEREVEWKKKMAEREVEWQKVAGTSDQLETKMAELRSELQSGTDQLNEAHTQLQEKVEVIVALEQEVRDLRQREETLTDQLCDCAEDCEKLKSEKYLALEDERELHQKELEKQRQASEHALLELQSQLQEKATVIVTLEEAVQMLKKREESLTNQLAEQEENLMDQAAEMIAEKENLHKKIAQMQQVPAPCPVAMAEAEGKIKDLMEQNLQLKSQVQAYQTYQPSPQSAGAICCDSSGTITSAAYYHLRGEVKRVQEEKSKLESRVEKLKDELKKKQELYTKEQGECNRYRTERNVFRAKYVDLKERHAVLQARSGANVNGNTESSALSNQTPSQPMSTSQPSISVPPPYTSQPSISLQPPSTSQPPTSLQPPSTSQPPRSIPPYTSQPPRSIPPYTSQPPRSIPPPSSRPPPVAALPTPKSKPRHSIFSYVPPNPQQSHRGQGQGVLPGKKAHVFTSDIAPRGHSENFPPKTGVAAGGDSSAPQGVPSSEQLWDMSMIQTAPQAPLGTRGPRDQDKCHQQ